MIGQLTIIDSCFFSWHGVARFLSVARRGIGKNAHATDFFTFSFSRFCFSVFCMLAWLGGMVARKKTTSKIDFAFFCN